MFGNGHGNFQLLHHKWKYRKKVLGVLFFWLTLYRSDNIVVVVVAGGDNVNDVDNFVILLCDDREFLGLHGYIFRNITNVIHYGHSRWMLYMYWLNVQVFV